MAFLPGFEHDLFVSYCHVDNLGHDPWVERFQEYLEISLARRIGRIGVAKIWRDKRLDGGQLFDITIKSAIESSGLFLAMTSSGYLESEYCRQELQSFHGKASGEKFGLHIGDRSRIFNVLLSPIPHSRWPAEYGRISGFPFHDAGEDAEFGDPLDPDVDKQRFREQLTALANSLFKMLTAFKEKAGEDAGAPASSSEAPAGRGAPIFIADVADSLRPVRKRLITELQRKGVTIESGVPPPYEAAPHEHRVRAVARGAMLSVHLLDAIPGREILGEPGSSYPQRQLDLARGEAKTQLIWVPKALDASQIEDETYRDFLTQLEHGERSGAHYDFVRGVSTALAPQILERLEQLQPEPHPAEGSGSAILVDTHLKDQLYAFEIGRFLLENNVQPYINPQEDDPNKNLDTFEARLGQVSSLAIIYGEVSESWVRHRLGVALQLSILRNLPLKSFAVVMVPPEKQKQTTNFSLGPVAVRMIDNSRSPAVDRSALAPLFLSERAGGGR
jgi:hypothetical protein